MVQIVAPDVDAGGAPKLTQVAQTQVDVVVAPRILSTSDELASRDEMQKGLDEQRRYLHLDYEYPGTPSRTDLVIRNASEEIIHQEAYQGAAQSRAIRWNGVLQSGRIVATGNYTAQVVVTQDGEVIGATERHPFAVIRTNLDVDTDRDGVVDDEKDEAGKGDWTKDRGAIYAVNLDADEHRLVTDKSGTHLVPDAVDFNDQGIPTDDDPWIRTPSDEEDLTPLVLRVPGAALPKGMRVFVKAESLEDAEAIHVFPKIEAGTEKILGGIGSRAGGPPTPTEVDVTSYLLGEQGAGDDPSIGDQTLGVEGLLFRNPTGPLPLRFDGEIVIRLEYRDGDRVVFSNSVRLKVAPWVMLPNSQQTQELWVAPDVGNVSMRDGGDGYPGLSEIGDRYREVLDGSAKGSQWLQDHVEVGYYERPIDGKRVRTIATLRMPYKNQYLWPRNYLLRPGFAVFQLGTPVGTDQGAESGIAGSFGGNLELIPPVGSYPLGRIVVGDTASRELRSFLDAQQIQGPSADVPTRWLEVGHFDEGFAFSSRYAVSPVVYTADPRLALQRLAESDQELGEGAAVLFATGNERPVVGVVSRPTTDVPDTPLPEAKLYTDLDLTDSPWRYLRLFSGSSSGQVAEIKEKGNGFLTVQQVWWTGTTVVTEDAAGKSAWKAKATDPVDSNSTWLLRPQRGDRFVLVEGTKFWWGDDYGHVRSPALITVAEVLKDDLFKAYNEDVWNQIEDGRNRLTAAAGAGLEFRSVPVLFFGNPKQEFPEGRTAGAFNPDLVNGQFIDDIYYAPRQFGPKKRVGENGDGKAVYADALEWAMERRKGESLILPDHRFVDDWDRYHRSSGEVHCGTATVRRPLDAKWWEVQR